jgi:hypothetical protein
LARKFPVEELTERETAELLDFYFDMLPELVSIVEGLKTEHGKHYGSAK